jgi:hypothetical protein
MNIPEKVRGVNGVNWSQLESNRGSESPRYFLRNNGNQPNRPRVRVRDILPLFGTFHILSPKMICSFLLLAFVSFFQQTFGCKWSSLAAALSALSCVSAYNPGTSWRSNGFAAVKEDGSVASWPTNAPSHLSDFMKSGVTAIYSTSLRGHECKRRGGHLG